MTKRRRRSEQSGMARMGHTLLSRHTQPRALWHLLSQVKGPPSSTSVPFPPSLPFSPSFPSFGPLVCHPLVRHGRQGRWLGGLPHAGPWEVASPIAQCGPGPWRAPPFGIVSLSSLSLSPELHVLSEANRTTKNGFLPSSTPMERIRFIEPTLTWPPCKRIHPQAPCLLALWVSITVSAASPVAATIVCSTSRVGWQQACHHRAPIPSLAHGNKHRPLPSQSPTWSTPVPL